jgi:DNA mismatch repair ATPase MutS
VANDVTLGPPGRFLLITGSNMSGKSTLLRAVGLNVVLAHAGAPACARRLTLPPLSLHTSMRVSDSLERGLSLFMASLVRLERIVRAARAAPPERCACYLLDEVLQGTNSAERQIAVRTVVSHLVACHAIGAVTTHDLELARDPAFTDHADSYHLQETLSGTGDAVTMTFDYRLRPGPAQSGNALQLLRMLGLAAVDGSAQGPGDEGRRT